MISEKEYERLFKTIVSFRSCYKGAMCYMNNTTGVFTGLMIMSFMLLLPDTVIDRYEKAMDLCKKELPIDKECEIIAIRIDK